MRNSVLWAWTRTADQIQFAPGAEEKILELSIRLWNRYSHDTIELISKGDTKEKLARMSIAFASIVKSTAQDDSIIVVTPEICEACYRFVCAQYDAYGLDMASYTCRKKSADLEVERRPEESRSEYSMRSGQAAYKMVFAIATKSFLGNDTETINLLFETMLKVEKYSIGDLCTMLGTEKKDLGKFFRALINGGFVKYTAGSGVKDVFVRTEKLNMALRYMVYEEMQRSLPQIDMVKAIEEEKKSITQPKESEDEVKFD
jgi:hypothetical protein